MGYTNRRRPNYCVLDWGVSRASTIPFFDCARDMGLSKSDAVMACCAVVGGCLSVKDFDTTVQITLHLADARGCGEGWSSDTLYGCDIMLQACIRDGLVSRDEVLDAIGCGDDVLGN